jgi:predicted nucleic acid-binding protein
VGLWEFEVGWWGRLAGWWCCGSFAKDTSIFVTISSGVSFLLASATESDDLCVCVCVRVREAFGIAKKERKKESKQARKKHKEVLRLWLGRKDLGVWREGVGDLAGSIGQEGEGGCRTH